MGYKISEVKQDEEFDQLFICFRDSFTNPGNALWPLLIGDWQPHNPLARKAALKEGTARFLSWHHADPTSTWLKVIDEDSGEILGGGRWSIYENANPYDGHGPVEATWFPEGEPRIIATKLVNDFLATASKNANRPHAFLNILFTSPGHRRKGVASLIMDWGLQKAREKGLDVYIEATKEGKPLYEKYGLVVIDQNSFEVDEACLPATTNPEARKLVTAALTPFTWWSMVKTA